MKQSLRNLTLVVGSITLCAAVAAHVRLIYSGNGQELYWQNPAGISLVIQGMGSQDVPGNSDDVALRSAIAAWNGWYTSFFHCVFSYCFIPHLCNRFCTWTNKSNTMFITNINEICFF